MRESVESDVFKNGLRDGVLDDDVDELDVLGVGGARRVQENLTIVRIRVPGPEIPAIITSCRWLSRSGVYSIRVFTDL